MKSVYGANVGGIFAKYAYKKWDFIPLNIFYMVSVLNHVYKNDIQFSIVNSYIILVWITNNEMMSLIFEQNLLQYVETIIQ